MSGNQTETLNEILKWLRFMGMQEAKQVVDDALTYPEDKEEKEKAARIAYELTDGSNSQRDITKHISFSKYWVASRHDEWEKLGIIERNSEGYAEHIISLKETGLECPEIPDPEEEDEEESEDQADLIEATDD